MKRIYLLAVFVSISSRLFSQDSLQFYYNQGIESFNSKDFNTYQLAFESANRIRPYHPTIIYHLARANAFLKNDAATFETLKIMTQMTGNLKALSDSTFTDFKSTDYISQLSQLEEKVNKLIQNSSVFLSADISASHPESMAMIDNQVYFGAVNGRKVLKIDQRNKSVEDLIDFGKHEDLYAVMGLTYDKKNDLIWACTAALLEMQEYSEDLKGNSSIVAIDKNGKVIKSEKISGNHLFGDLIIKDDGVVYISDGSDNSIYTTSLDGSLRKKFDLSDRAYNLQGLTFNQDQSQLFIADYIKGVLKVDLSTKEGSFLTITGDLISKGFDGLYFYKNSLIAIQNGTDPDRVWRLYLNEEGDKVVRNEIIDQALEVYGEPTQGLIEQDCIYYIANSPWPYYKDGKLNTESLSETIVLKAALK